MRQQWARDEEYVTLDEIRERYEDTPEYEGYDADDEELATYIAVHGYVPAKCSICERELPEDAHLPLCRSCESTARAHARQIQAHHEWIADGAPD